MVTADLKGPTNSTVLLIDDEPMVLTIGAQMLEKLGYRVIEASSGQEAITLYQANSQHIDFVILDMIMPGFGGGETFDELKKLNPDLKFILSSGYQRDSQANAIMQRGCDGFIQKPFRLEDLARLIGDILGRE
jgi:two-component system cell cycle sensor histidine kinase/response regulator CckA